MNYCDQHRELKWEVRILFALMGVNEVTSILTGRSVVELCMGVML